jgi:hypothetical protein
LEHINKQEEAAERDRRLLRPKEKPAGMNQRVRATQKKPPDGGS